MGLGLVLRQDSGGDLLVDPGVVVGQARQLAGAIEVGPAVADVSEREDLLVEEAGDDGRAHALEPRLRGDRRHDALVGLLDRDRQPVAVEEELVVVLERPGRLFLLARRGDELADGLDGDLGRDLAGGVSAHAVGDDEEALGPRPGRRRPRCACASCRRPSGRMLRSSLIAGIYSLPARCTRISSSAFRASPAEGSQRKASW